jgi:VPDSG-CTERM motif
MKNKLLLLCSLATALSAMTAGAFNITVDSLGNPLNGTGVANKSQYGSGNSNPTSDLNFLLNQISLWNGSPNVPEVPSLLDSQLGPPRVGASYDITGNSYTALPGWQYVVFHFGNGQAGGSPGGYYQAWYLGGNGGTFTVPSVGGKPVGGFSSARYVPDGGSTVMLLGAALGVIAAARRKFGV